MSKLKPFSSLTSSGSKLLKKGSGLVDSSGRFLKKSDKKLIDIPALKTKLSDGLVNTMETAFESRKADKENSKYSPEDAEEIIKGYANQNMILAAASSIVPGPMGMLGAVPELLLNVRNQMSMIYDLGCAFDKENFINRDLLLDIPIAAFGGKTNLAEMQNSRKDLMDSPKAALAGKATQLGEALIQRTLKKSVVQFIPVAGPIVLGAWSKMATAKISKGTLSFLDNSVNYTENLKLDENTSVEDDIKIEKIKCLINLTEINGEITEHEIEFISAVIESAEISRAEKDDYMSEAVKLGSQYKLDLELLKAYEEGMDLIMEMVVLAKCDGVVDDMEKTYIYKIAQDLALDASFVSELISD